MDSEHGRPMAYVAAVLSELQDRTSPHLRRGADYEVLDILVDKRSSGAAWTNHH